MPVADTTYAAQTLPPTARRCCLMPRRLMPRHDTRARNIYILLYTPRDAMARQARYARRCLMRTQRYVR